MTATSAAPYQPAALLAEAKSGIRVDEALCEKAAHQAVRLAGSTRQGRLDPPERFSLERIEGLERLAAHV